MAAILPGYSISGNGDPVILLHASLSSRKQWRGVRALLSERYRVIAVDLYGYGDTPLPLLSRPFTLQDEVELVRPLLERLLPGGTPFHLVGHSYGGAVALSFCHYHPELVRSVCAFEPVSFHLLNREDPRLAAVREMARTLDLAMTQGSPHLAAQTFLDYWGGAGTFAAYPPRLQEEFASRTPKLRLDFEALTGTPITVEHYASLAVPVRLICGEQSRPPALLVTDLLSRAVRDCTVSSVPAGHLAPLTHPELVNPLIAQSLER